MRRAFVLIPKIALWLVPATARQQGRAPAHVLPLFEVHERSIVDLQEADDLGWKGNPARMTGIHKRPTIMTKTYDFAKARPNPDAGRLKRTVTIRLDQATIAYFKELADETGIGYQTRSIPI